MKIYDTHSDIMFNLYNRTMNGEKDVFAKYHLDDLKKGGIAGGIWVIYSETDFDIQQAYDSAIHAFKPYEKEFDVLYGLEGLRNVKNIDELNVLYQKGIRHASLTFFSAPKVSPFCSREWLQPSKIPPVLSGKFLAAARILDSGI